MLPFFNVEPVKLSLGDYAWVLCRGRLEEGELPPTQAAILPVVISYFQFMYMCKQNAMVW